MRYLGQMSQRVMEWMEGTALAERTGVLVLCGPGCVAQRAHNIPTNSHIRLETSGQCKL